MNGPLRSWYPVMVPPLLTIVQSHSPPWLFYQLRKAMWESVPNEQQTINQIKRVEIASPEVPFFSAKNPFKGLHFVARGFEDFRAFWPTIFTCRISRRKRIINRKESPALSIFLQFQGFDFVVCQCVPAKVQVTLAFTTSSNISQDCMTNLYEI